MITIFRKIRQNLLADGKTGKYLKYALGEILLVVIGILIALQINNWNDTRKAHKRERILLNQLHHEFLNNQKLFNESMKIYENKFSAMNKVTGFYALPQEEKADSLRMYLRDIFIRSTYNPSNGLVESLLNSSSIETIQNDSLKHLLISWKDVLEDYKEEEEQIAIDCNDLSDYFNQQFDFSNLSDPNIPINNQNIEAFNSTRFNNHVLKISFSTSQILIAPERETIGNHLKEIVRLSKEP